MRIAVVGAGVVGLAVTYELARAGRRADCFEAGTPMGARSCGDTRIFRLAHDRPALVDWARQAHQGWREWSAAAGDDLVGHQRTVVSGDIGRTATAMADAGAAFEIVDAVPALPARDPAGPFLVDVTGGVIRAASTGRFLLDAIGGQVVHRTITGIHRDGDAAVLEAHGWHGAYDGVVVAAGARTPMLLSQWGIAAPDRLIHHARLTFPLRDPDAAPPCWLDRSSAWRPGFTSYGQLAAPGRWAVGGSLPAQDTRWELGREASIARARATLTDYVTEYVTGCLPTVLDHLYCDVTEGLGDGLTCVTVGPVIGAWGDNLFKMAPIAGRMLAEAVVTGEVAASLRAVTHLT